MPWHSKTQFRTCTKHIKQEEKYTYFLLAAAGAAIGFAVQKTEGLKLSWWLLPGALATVSWAASFVFGCKNVEWVHTAISANMALLQLRSGSHPQQPPHPQLAGVAIEGVGSAVQHNIGKAAFYRLWQFRFLTLGAVFFIDIRTHHGTARGLFSRTDASDLV